MKLKVIRTVNRGLNEEDRISTATTEQITEQILDYLTSSVSNGFMKECLRNELITRSDSYTKFPHSPVIKGWLGEMYWNAAFSYITGTVGASYPTGSIHNVKGHQLSVDLIYKEAGFQIKNWTFNSAGQKRIEKQMKFGNFISDRAVLLDTYVGQILAQMFGAASYNRPNEEYNKTGSFVEYRSTYGELADLTKRLEPLTDIFYASLNKIIEIDNGNELKELLPHGGEKIYYNTFWLLKDKIVPSSVIIKQLIDDVRSGGQEQGAVTFKVLSMTDGGKAFWPDPNTKFGNKDMANRWSIKYEYIFNLARLLEQVAHKL